MTDTASLTLNNTQLNCFKRMLALQETMNIIVHPQWRTQKFVWYRAIWTECAEMLDHLGWKWWKKQEPHWQQVHLELIDIWHFGLSHLLETIEDHHALSLHLQAGYQAVSAMNSETHSVESLRESIEIFTQACLATKGFPLDLFYQVLFQANLTLEDLYRHYVGKNVLNRFRQDNGYKQGSYLKEWQGREDNEHLAEILISIDVSHPQITDAIYQQLTERYAEAS